MALVNGPNDTIPDDSILVADVLETDYSTETIKMAKGIITEDGGILSHAAILARELKIPCVVGVPDIMGKLKNGDKVVVDGSSGMVYKSDTLPPILNTTPTLDYSFIYDFSKMTEIDNTKSYYEQFDNMIVYYSEKEMDVAELQKNLGNKIDNKQIIYGSGPKYFIYKQYLLNNKDPEMNKLSQQAIEAAKSFNPKMVDDVSNMLLSKAKHYLEENDKLENKEALETKKLIVLNLMRAGWCYTLVNTVICEGYAITTMDKKLHDIFKGNESTVFDFTSAIDSGEEFNYGNLSNIEKDELKNAKEFYTMVRRWRLDSYPMFKDIGATGNEYQSKIRGLVASLSTHGESSNEVKAGIIDFFNSKK